MNNSFLIGKWKDRITCGGWHLLRQVDQPEDFIFRVVNIEIGGVHPEKHADILHEAYGCYRVPFDRELTSVRVIPISFENALRCIDNHDNVRLPDMP